MRIRGYVDHIIYRKEENGYTVLVLSFDASTVDKQELPKVIAREGEITVVGSFREMEEGEMAEFEGELVDHPSYGCQLKASSCTILIPEGSVAIERYLASGAIKGIGVALAKRIVRVFGDDTFRIMEEEPERLVEIKGISERIARSISEQICEKKDMRRVMLFLQELGISPNLSMKIYAKYDQKTIDIISENPYRLVEDVQGVGFVTADEIAKNAGFSSDSDYRISSGILYTLMQASVDGHTYLPRESLTSYASQLLGVSGERIEDGIERLIMESKLIEKDFMEEKRIFTPVLYYMEMDCARLLMDMDADYGTGKDRTRSKILAVSGAEDIELDEAQLVAVEMAATRGVSVITGGPGTGKTTIIKILLGYFDGEGLDVFLAAPTGRAAKRMTEATGYEARTIHRMLEIGAESTQSVGGFGRDDKNPLETDVVIVDEMSMVDIYLFHALLKAMVSGTRLIMVGDASQLPSVGPGSVLKDIIMSGVFGVSALEHVFRQAAKSDIIMNAHRINQGLDIKLDNKSSDFFFLERDNAEVIIESIVYLVTKKLPPYVDAKPFDIQVMTPMRKGILGVINLNMRLQERLNPPSAGKREMTFGQLTLREGDKVMQIKNNYQLEWEVTSRLGIVVDRGLGVFNGDMGVVILADNQAGILKVKFDDDRVVTYQQSQLEELELAYAITIHKSQGSEYPAAVLPLLSGPSMLMNRNLLYTALTRARKCVTVIGSSQTVRDMIKNENEQVRFTDLKERIKEFAEA